jgi:hypothetical protein
MLRYIQWIWGEYEERFEESKSSDLDSCQMGTVESFR